MKSIKKNMILNIIKQSCNIIFPLITFPYISRVLGASIYGKVNFGHSIIGYISLIAAFGITNYAVREGASKREHKEELNQFASEIFSINVLSTFVAYIVLVVLLLSWRKLDDYRLLIIIQSLAVAFTTLGVEWLYTVEEEFAYITIRSIIFQAISVVLMLLLVKKPEDYLIYAGISVFAGGGSAIFNIIRSRKYVRLRFTFKNNIRKHIGPVLILFASAITTVIYVNSDTTMLGIMKSDFEVGIYSAATKIYSLVKQMINAALVVCVPRIAYYVGQKSKEEVSTLLNKVLEGILMFGIPAMIGLACLSKNIIVLFASDEYMDAYKPLMVLSVALIFALLASFETTQILIPYKKEKQVLIPVVISALANIVLNLFMIPLWGATAAAITTLISEMIVTIMCIYWVKPLYKAKLSKNIISYFVGGAMIAIICYATQKIISGNFSCIIVSVVMSVLMYFGLLFVTKNEMFLGIVRGPLRKLFRKQ